MKYLVTGAGQIGSQLICDLISEGHTVNVLRASKKDIPGATLFAGDVRDRELVKQAARGCDAIFHCVHAPYDSRKWAEILPDAERVVMDQGLPVVFPESVYALAGHEEIREGSDYAPIDGKGEVRKLLLEQRKAHETRTVSIVAADLYGPTATSRGSVLKTTVLGPKEKKLPIVVLANPESRHSFTYIPDLTSAMRWAANTVDKQGVFHAPTAPAVRLREWAGETRMWSVPASVLKVAGKLDRTMFELAEISPIWYRDCVLLPGELGVPSLMHGD